MIAPTHEEIFNEELKEVWRETDDSWRHGCYVSEVYLRESDMTYWMVDYELSNDGESNGLREKTASIEQVEPVEVITTTYKAVKDKQ